MSILGDFIERLELDAEPEPEKKQKPESDSLEQSIRTYEGSGGMHAYSSMTYQNLEDLKQKLKAEGVESVSLIQFHGGFDDYGSSSSGSVNTEDLTEEHLQWGEGEGDRVFQLHTTRI